ncbi:hypothetical protein LPY66_11390 [Dehalobacter sp. DCM]|nr:hypothetical protein LPY66_11390 [Dehalobacter sp. DCM]
MNFLLDSAIFKGATSIINLFGVLLPFEYTGPKNEFLAAREAVLEHDTGL